MKVAVLTSQHLRHSYLLNVVGTRHDVVAVVRERKRAILTISLSQSSLVLIRHLEERKTKEKQYFGAHRALRVVNPLDVDAGEANSLMVFEYLKRAEPDLLLLFGTSIITLPILSYFEGRIVNMHLGLSPYYRGSGTNFWPLVNNQPECVGVTIHHAVLKVDAGAILCQSRAEMSADDGGHDIGCKAIIAGVASLLTVLDALSQRSECGVEQPEAVGLLYKRRDFNEGAVLTMQRNLRDGMIPLYLERREQRNKAFSIVAR